MSVRQSATPASNPQICPPCIDTQMLLRAKARSRWSSLQHIMASPGHAVPQLTIVLCSRTKRSVVRNLRAPSTLPTIWLRRMYHGAPAWGWKLMAWWAALWIRFPHMRMFAPP